jgi:hypothetical protein
MQCSFVANLPVNLDFVFVFMFIYIYTFQIGHSGLITSQLNDNKNVAGKIPALIKANIIQIGGS